MRRVRNLIMFAAAVLAVGLLVIGVTALIDGDQSGWRAMIGGVLAITLAGSLALRAGRPRPPS